MTVLDRFLQYVSYPTMSDEASTSSPSTAKQLALGKHLAEELQGMGISNAHLDEFGYVYAFLPANVEGDIPSGGFIAHMDTSDSAPDQPICAKVVEYKGEDICLQEQKQYFLRAEDYPVLEHCRGQHLVVTDGTTLLGADDKAGIAEIMTAVEPILTRKLPHGDIAIAFTPDEEIGRGVEHFRLEKFPASYAYTLDGGQLGELEYENFNAASAEVTVRGLSIHPGSAKGKMKNASLIACEFHQMLPPEEIPAKTEGYEGFFHLVGMEGEIETAKLNYIIRDHDKENFQARKELFRTIAQDLNQTYGEGTVTVTLRDSYYNMREKLEGHMEILARARDAMQTLSIPPIEKPIRGGTDGAMLSFRGLPCPNLGTGGYNFHSRFEFASVEEMEQASELIVQLVIGLVEEVTGSRLN